MKYWIPALLTLGLSGCMVQKDMTDLHQYIEQVKARKPPPIEPIPQIKQAETFLYIPNDRRDPFSPNIEVAEVPIEEEEEFGPRPDPTRRKEELEAYPLDSLRMVGTLDKDGIRWALIQTPDKTIHRVTVGNYLGQHDGKIIAIEEEKVVLIELVPNARGGYIERQSALALGERE